jgi:phosphoglycerol geranylgeranyltransferase
MESDQTDIMNTSIYKSVFSKGRKVFALLIDPEKLPEDVLKRTIEEASRAQVDVILVGGSLTSMPIDGTLDAIKALSTIPVVLFPGNLLQLSAKADGVLLLSMISGRNPEFLIGNHVLASRFLKKTGIEIIPTGYVLIDGHCLSSVEYMSNTRPIPADKSDIIISTALAGEQLGLKLIYLETGSGAHDCVRDEIVSQVQENLTIPLIVGGGIKTAEDVRRLYQAGASGVVVGTAVENDYRILPALAAVRDEFNR